MSDITIENEQVKIQWSHYRGDSLRKSLMEFYNVLDDESKEPVDISDWTFKIQIRRDANASEVIAEFDNTYFVKGQTTLATDYDTAEGNPAGTTKDEVSVDIPGAKLNFDGGDYVFDVQYTTGTGEIKTPILAFFKLIQDVAQ